MSKKQIRVYGIGPASKEYITFGMDIETVFHDYDKYQKFIKGCEDAVRNDDRYTAYVAKMHEAGLNQCAILGNMEDKKVKLEMHHGPIFNLFDICDIVTRAMVKRKQFDEMTTFDIADLVLEEHRLHNVMTVMLSKTAHKGSHNRKGHHSIFVDIRATVGRIDRFIDRYQDGMEAEHWEYVSWYQHECEKAGGSSIDNGLFDTAEKLEKFK